MLSSIHPFGERSRNNSFGLTASAHVVGSTLGGALLGVVVGTVAAGLAAVWSVDSTVRAVALSAVALVALGFEATGRERSLPTRQRQVNENWLQIYRGWVYGGGFGFELGFGLSTIITTALVHVMVAAMVLSGSFAWCVVLGTVFGFVRGATVLAAAPVDTPDRLRALHRRLDGLRSTARVGAVVALGAIGMAGVAAVGL